MSEVQQQGQPEASAENKEDAKSDALVKLEEAEASLRKRMDEFVKVPKPDQEKRDAKVNDIKAKVDRLMAERQKIDKQQQSARAGSKPYNDKRKELIGKLKELRGKRGKLIDAAKTLQVSVDAINKKDKERRQKDKAAQQSLKFRSVEEVDEKLRELERKHETTSLSKQEEKDMMKEISTLRQTRRKVEEYLKQKSSSAAGIEDVAAMKEEVKAKYQDADSFKEEIDKLSAELDELMVKNKDASSKAEKLQKKRNEIQTELSALFAERDEVREAHNTEWKAYKEYLDKFNKLRDEERKLREEYRKKEIEEYERRLEEEEMKKKPWEEEIALCDFLTNYLEKIIYKDKKQKQDDVEGAGASSSATAAASDAPEIRRSADDFQGLQPIGKKSTELDDFLVMGGGKQKKSKSKKKKQNERLTHSIDLLGSFSLLGLQAPTKIEDVPASIKELQDKRAHYDVLPRAPRKKKTEEGAGQEEKREQPQDKKKKSGKKAAAPQVDSSELFPELPGSKSTKPPPTPTNGPSARDVLESSKPNGAATAEEPTE